MKTKLRLILALSLLFILGACSSTQSTAAAGNEPQPESDERVMVVQNALSLQDLLVRVPGVYIDGNNVSIRGRGAPLYIIDGVRIGHSYAAAASAVNINDVKSVEVLKSANELSLYGLEGQNGVIIIRTY